MVELKIVRTSDEVVGQVLRYMGWIKTRFADKSDTVKGAILAPIIDVQALLAIEVVPGIDLYTYKMAGNRLQLEKETMISYYLKDLSHDQLIDLQARVTKLWEERRESSTSKET